MHTEREEYVEKTRGKCAMWNGLGHVTHDTTVSSLIVMMARFTPCRNKVHGVARTSERGDADNTTGENATRAWVSFTKPCSQRA